MILIIIIIIIIIIIGKSKLVYENLVLDQDRKFYLISLNIYLFAGKFLDIIKRSFLLITSGS